MVVEKVVKEIGSQALVAKLLGISQQAVSVWVRKGYVPRKQALLLDLVVTPTWQEMVSGS